MVHEKLLQDTAERLGISHTPKLLQKATQLYTQLTVKFQSGALARHQNAKVAVCLQLACEQEQIKFNKSGAVQLSATTEKAYQGCVNQARSISPAEITFENLGIRFGCNQAISWAREVYNLFEGKIPPADKPKIDLSESRWNAAIFEIVCKKLKVQIKKSDLVEVAAVDQKNFNKTVTYIHTTLGSSLVDILTNSTTTTIPSKGTRTTTKRKRIQNAVDIVIDTAMTKESIAEEEDGEVQSSKRLETPARQTAQQTPIRKSIRTSPRNKSKDGHEVDTHLCSTPLQLSCRGKGKLPNCNTAAIATRTSQQTAAVSSSSDVNSTKPKTTTAVTLRETLKTSTKSFAERGRVVGMIPSLPYNETRKYKEYQAWRVQFLKKLAVE